MKILILRFSSIGDIILTSPVVRCLKEQVPNLELDFCTKTQFSFLLQANPYINNIISFNKSINEVLNQIRNEQYDYIIDLHHNLRTFQIKLNKSFSTEVSSFNKINIEKWLAVKFKMKKLLPNVHIVDRYMESISFLGVKNDNKGLDYFFSKKDISSPITYEKNYIAGVIGGQFNTKQFPIEKWIDLIKNKSDQKFVLLGGKDDVEASILIEQACSNVINLVGKCDFDQSALVVKNAALVLTNDTGLMHVAAAFKKKIISFWGNTIPEFGMYPYLTEFHLVENKEISCRPCSKIGYATCPKKHFACMNHDSNEIKKHIV